MLSASGIRLGIYYKFVRIMLYFVMKSRDVFFLNVFNFVTRYYEPPNELVVNEDPFMAITFTINLLSYIFE
jgi:hypothetical protein